MIQLEQCEQQYAAFCPVPIAKHLVTVNFDLPIFSVELRADLGEGERSLVELSFREFSLNYKKANEYETTLQVSDLFDLQ